MAEEQEKSSSKLKWIVIIGVALLVLVGTVVTTLLLTGVLGGEEPKAKEEAKTEQKAEAPKKPIYFPLKPEFTVNFQDSRTAHYMQVSVQVLTYDPKVVEAMKAHDPVIRNNLLLLFSQQNADQLKTRQGKEQLRELVEAEISKVLEERTGSDGVEDVYFTSFVMQ